MGEDAALAAYAEWLPHSPYGMGLYSGPRPNPRLFEYADIRDAARRMVNGAWKAAADGWIDSDGKMTRLAPGSAVNVLVQFAPVWEKDRAIARGLLAWAASSDTNRCSAGLMGLARATLNPEEREEAFAVIEALVAGGGGLHGLVTMPAAVDLAVAQGLVTRLIAPLRALVERGHSSVIAVAAALVGALSGEEARTVSERAAVHPIDFLSFDRIPKERVTDLVNQAPLAWGEAVVTHARAYGDLGLGPVAPLFNVLPATQKRNVALRLRDLVQLELPWCTLDFHDEPFRPLDLVERFLFDCGEL
jgi:hypothetical protein